MTQQTNDIVNRLRVQRTNSVLCAEAAGEIERLRATLKKAEAVLLEGGNLMTETVADRDWWRDKAVDYAHDDETCECDRCDAVMRAYTGCTCRSQPNACPEHHDPTRD